jgi:tRNA threonylcarbamoyladenosine biosynthesis protein TsaE
LTILRLESKSSAETKRIGQKLGSLLKKGDVVALEGQLGSGKTTMAKGIAKGLGVMSEEGVSSPSFVLIHEYQGREKIYHIDWYRLSTVTGADEALARECFASEAVTLVEWPERGAGVFPEEHLKIRFRHKNEKARLIEITGVGTACKALEKELTKKLS